MCSKGRGHAGREHGQGEGPLGRSPAGPPLRSCPESPSHQLLAARARCTFELILPHNCPPRRRARGACPRLRRIRVGPAQASGAASRGVRVSRTTSPRQPPAPSCPPWPPPGRAPRPRRVRNTRAASARAGTGFRAPGRSTSARAFVRSS